MPENTSSTESMVTLLNDRDIQLTRIFNAPPRLVFETWTKPEHMKRWWGPRNRELFICEIDLRVGGSYRHVLRSPKGHEYGFTGVFREIVPPSRLVYTFVFEGMPDQGAVETVVFEEIEPGKTLVTATMEHVSREARDAHLKNGMEAGARETYERLAELLQALQSA